MTRRTTYFVGTAEWQEERWRVTGEVGLGPVLVGDVFDGVHRGADGSEERSPLTVVRLDGRTVVLAGDPELSLEAGDVLYGERDEESNEPPPCPAARRLGEESTGPEHAQPGSDHPTLCGIPSARVTMYRHTFKGGSSDCPLCTVRVWNLPR